MRSKINCNIKKPTEKPVVQTEKPEWFKKLKDDDEVILVTVTINKPLERKTE